MTFLFLILPSPVTTSAACEKLERDRNELQATYEGFLQKLNEQHHSDLAELEERLKQFYTAECEKLQSICIEEAEKYKAQLQEQVCGIWSRNILQQLFSTSEPLRNLYLFTCLFILAINECILSNVKLYLIAITKENVSMQSWPSLKVVF